MNFMGAQESFKQTTGSWCLWLREKTARAWEGFDEAGRSKWRRGTWKPWGVWWRLSSPCWWEAESTTLEKAVNRWMLWAPQTLRQWQWNSQCLLLRHVFMSKCLHHLLDFQRDFWWLEKKVVWRCRSSPAGSWEYHLEHLHWSIKYVVSFGKCSEVLRRRYILWVFVKCPVDIS